jgi:hypothetical protein
MPSYLLLVASSTVCPKWPITEVLVRITGQVSEVGMHKTTHLPRINFALGLSWDYLVVHPQATKVSIKDIQLGHQAIF